MKRRSLLQAAAAALPARGWLRAQQPVVPPKPSPAAVEEIPVIESAIPDIAANSVASFFSPEQLAALQRLADVIAPALDGVPGARQTGAAEFLDFLIGQSPADRQELYRTGLDELNERAKREFDTSFAQLTDAQADRILAPLRTPWSLKPDPFTGFLRSAKQDILQATQNSRERVRQMSKRVRSAGGLGMYWYPIE